MKIIKYDSLNNIFINCKKLNILFFILLLLLKRADTGESAREERRTSMPTTESRHERKEEQACRHRRVGTRGKNRLIFPLVAPLPRRNAYTSLSLQHRRIGRRGKSFFHFTLYILHLKLKKGRCNHLPLCLKNFTILKNKCKKCCHSDEV